jgi:hypothetical protein
MKDTTCTCAGGGENWEIGPVDETSRVLVREATFDRTRCRVTYRSLHPVGQHNDEVDSNVASPEGVKVFELPFVLLFDRAVRLLLRVAAIVRAIPNRNSSRHYQQPRHEQ